MKINPKICNPWFISLSSHESNLSGSSDYFTKNTLWMFLMYVTFVSQKDKNTHFRHQRQEVPQRFLPLKPADQHTSTHTTHQGSAGRWEEHRGERDGRSLARPLSPHHPASPSQQERALNQRSKQRKGVRGGRGRKEGERAGRDRCRMS